MQLQGKTVLIAGARRVGAQLALQLAWRGANIALSCFRSRERMESVAREVRAAGAECLVVEGDLRQPAYAENFVARSAERFGSVDVLIDMVSEFRATPFETLSPAEFDESIAVNLKAPWLVAMAAARAMRMQPAIDGLQGKIIFFGDWAAERPYRGFLPYMIAKGALATLTKALAVELAPTIAVNAIAPAMIDPPPELSAEEIEAIRQASPLKRVGVPTDANNLALFLLEGTDFATGTVYRIDGGRFLGTGET